MAQYFMDESIVIRIKLMKYHHAEVVCFGRPDFDNQDTAVSNPYKRKLVMCFYKYSEADENGENGDKLEVMPEQWSLPEEATEEEPVFELERPLSELNQFLDDNINIDFDALGLTSLLEPDKEEFIIGGVEVEYYIQEKISESRKEDGSEIYSSPAKIIPFGLVYFNINDLLRAVNVDESDSDINTFYLTDNSRTYVNLGDPDPLRKEPKWNKNGLTSFGSLIASPKEEISTESTIKKSVSYVEGKPCPPHWVPGTYKTFLRGREIPEIPGMPGMPGSKPVPGFENPTIIPDGIGPKPPGPIGPSPIVPSLDEIPHDLDFNEPPN